MQDRDGALREISSSLDLSIRSLRRPKHKGRLARYESDRLYRLAHLVARYYEKVFGARILSLGDGNAPGYLQLANIWMIVNVGGGPTPDKPTVSLSVPDPNHISSFMNFRVADIQACYELWKSRGAEFLTEPIPKYGEIRCYIRDPDGYIIEVGQSTDQTYG
jgi:catechol 2,3-dioxygenase-like lactoylglutathione lyase family enzyme